MQANEELFRVGLGVGDRDLIDAWSINVFDLTDNGEALALDEVLPRNQVVRELELG